MRCLFKDNIPLVEFVLRIITDKPDLMITNCETQKDMKRLAGARSICLDAYGMDSAGKKYDLEIQRQDKGADPHRARYHSYPNLYKIQTFFLNAVLGTFLEKKVWIFFLLLQGQYTTKTGKRTTFFFPFRFYFFVTFIFKCCQCPPFLLCCYVKIDHSCLKLFMSQ